jgi:hypothetical protein
MALASRSIRIGPAAFGRREAVPGQAHDPTAEAAAFLRLSPNTSRNPADAGDLLCRRTPEGIVATRRGT